MKGKGISTAIVTVTFTVTFTDTVTFTVTFTVIVTVTFTVNDLFIRSVKAAGISISISVGIGIGIRSGTSVRFSINFWLISTLRILFFQLLVFHVQYTLLVIVWSN